MKWGRHFVIGASATAFVMLSASAIGLASEQTRPTPEQMEAVRACAAKQGVGLPSHPPGPPPGPPPGGMGQKSQQGGQQNGSQGGSQSGPPEGGPPGRQGAPGGDNQSSGGDHNGPPPQQNGGQQSQQGQLGQHQGPPRLNEAQRAILDACFKANGLNPPQPSGPQSGGGPQSGHPPPQPTGTQ